MRPRPLILGCTACALLGGLVIGLAAAADLVPPLRLAEAKPVAAPAPAASEDRAGKDLDDLRRRIREAQRDLSATEESRSEAADALRKSEKAISESTRTLRELAQQETDAQVELARLTARQSTSREAIAAGQAKIAAQLRHQYQAGAPDALVLLLSGDDPARLARDTEYLRRLALARAQTVETLRRNLADLAADRAQAQSKAEELAKMREKGRLERARLEKESAGRAALVAELSNRLQAQKRNLQTMERDEKRLTQLVERIAKALEERRVQREKAQKERAQKERAERDRQQRDKAARETARDRRSGDTRPPAGEPEGNSPDGGRTAPPEGRKTPDTVATIDQSAEEGYDTEAFPRMKGHLRLPVTGELANRFGSPREDSGLNWKGLFIRAPQGREVKAVASGRVVYSDWLRGFGNLLIIDHGSGYMSLYGNNESLFARVGDVVKGGVAVASVGNSGGNPEPGLYFEIRHQSRPFDPMSWVGKP